VSRFSVVIPVKDGERYLEELLAALTRENPDEVLVIDSGSRDRSVQIARAAGADVLSIEPHEFGHGRTRNLGAERTRDPVPRLARRVPRGVRARRARGRGVRAPSAAPRHQPDDRP
jgi:glycosyltransferase involved in cell wall biosynthesis